MFELRISKSVELYILIKHIGPNIDGPFKRATKIGLNPEEPLVTSISILMNEQNGSNYRETFVNLVACIHDYLVVPAALIDKK